MQAKLMALLQQQRTTEAKALCAKLCKANPKNAQLQFLMSAICGQLGEFDKSEYFCKRAIKINPNVPEAWYNLAVAQLNLGKNTAAIDNLKTALNLKPAFPEALTDLGNAYQRIGKHADAANFYQRAIQLKPDFSPAYCNLAEAQFALRDISAAENSLKTSIELNPRLSKARLSFGKILLEKGEKLLALEQFDAALSLEPDNVEHLNRIAEVLKDENQLADAESYYQKAISLAPDNAKLLSNYGLILVQLQKTDEAIALLTQATTLDPTLAEAFYNLATALSAANQQQACETRYLQALALRHEFPEAWMNLGTLRLLQGRLQEARSCFEHALVKRPDYPEAASNLLMALNYDETYSGDEIFERHRHWGTDLAARIPVRDLFPPHPDTNRTGLRIGFVSPDFRTHSVAYFFQSILDQTREDIEIFCYSNILHPDETTHLIRNKVSMWRDITQLSDSAVAELINADCLDALVDLAGHTSGNRLGVFALRPCAVQISYLGYPNTTGLATMDYRITDAIADPEYCGQSYTETLLRMERCFLCYKAKPNIPQPAPLGENNNRPVAFGSFNNLAKLTPSTIELWSSILLGTPGSTLLLKARPLGDSTVADHYREMFQKHGISPERLQLIGWLADAKHYLAYSQIDIALDTYPYNGTTTTCEALWMGRPVVTLAGGLHASRVGASLLSTVGLKNLIAHNPHEYIETAIRVANELHASDHEYHDLRSRMQGSALCDQTDFQKHFFALIEYAVATSATD
ncbi:MAG: tetratricopeptide repeat protein [Gammaproteobacteria bacterium]|nr:tetratricopeptide repeat protein [Gammaproteobacteria bacterium]